MKAYTCLLGLCLLAGIVSADFAWETGKSYKYNVHSRALAGITEIGNKYAGLQFTYEQILTPTGGNTVNVKTQNLKVVEVNQEFEQGWRQGQIDEAQEAQIPSELKRYLTSPMDMKIVKGVVQSIKVERDLPTWAVNIKRAQASIFTADTTGKNAIVQGNLNGQSNSVRPEQANQESGFFFEVVEQSVHGECQVYYTVSQNGPFDFPYQFQKQSQAGQHVGSGSQENQFSASSEEQSQWQSQGRQSGSHSSSSSSEESQESSVEKPWPQAFDKLCGSNDQVYEIIKTVNFTTCVQKPVLAFSSPAELNFHAGDNAGGSLWTRALITRILACGQSRRNYTILKITQQERFQTGLKNQEKIVAGTQKNVTLLSVSSGHPTPVRSPKTINNLVYQFDPQHQRQQLNKGQGQQQQQRQQQSSSSSEEQTSTQGYSSQEQGSSSGSQESRRNQQGSSEDYQQDAAYTYGQKNQYRQSRESQEQGQQQVDGSSEEIQNGQSGETRRLPQPTMDQAPLASMLNTPLNGQQMKQRVNELMQEVVQDLTKSTESQQESIAQRETISKINTLTKAIRKLNFQDIQEVSRKWIQGGGEKQQVAQQIFVDCVCMAGTNPAIKFVFQLIKSGHIHGEQAAQIISTLPLYIHTPTQQLLREFFQLLENAVVKRHEQTRTSAILAFTTLAHQACVNKKTKNTRYPVAVYGEFCQPQFVQQQFTPYFIQKLEKHLQQNQEQDKHVIFVYFKALANLGTPELIPVVQKCLDEQHESIIKVKAILALQNLVKSHGNQKQQQQQQYQGQQQQETIAADRQSYDVVTSQLVEKHVLPLLASVAFDNGEHPSVRAAAISLLVHCTYTDTALWQQLAMSTWFERSLSIHSLVHSIIYNLAQLQRPINQEQWHMQQKARQVVNLLKPIDASLARSHSIFTAQFLEEVNSGFSQHLQWIESKDAIIPNYVYYHSYFNFGNGAGGVSPLEISVAGNTVSKVISAVYQAIQGDGQQQQQQQQANQELSQIHSLLNIQPRKQEEPVVGNLFINVRNEMQRMWTVDEQTLERLTQQIIQKVMQTGQKKMPVNYQKVAQLTEHFASMPTAMGFPLVYRMRMTSLLSVRGQVQISNPSGPEFQVQADLAPVVAWKVHRQLAFKCPLTGKKYQSGVQRHFVVEMPVSVLARRAPRGQIQVAITPRHLNQVAPKGTIDLVTYHQMPYTAIIHDEFWPAIHPKGGQLQVVRSQEQQQQQQGEQFTRTRTFGQKALGLHFQVQEKSDYPVEQENVSAWTRFFRRFHTANCFFNAAWLGSPSIRYVERKLVLNLDQSETNTIVLVAGAKLQRVSVSEKLQSSEETSQEQQEHGSSSSESEEGQKFFNVVRSAKNYRQEQERYNKQQGQSQSRSQSQSSSESQSAEDQQTGGRVTKGPQRNVIAIALLGKKDPLQPLRVRNGQQQQQQQQSSSSSEEQQQQQSGSQEYRRQQQQQQSSSEEQRRQQQRSSQSQEQNSQEQMNGVQKPLQKGSPNTVQYLLHVAQSAQGKFFVRLSLGDAANEAAESLPQSKSLQAVREAVDQSPNGQSQPDACLEFQGTIDTPKQASRHVIAYTRQSLLEQHLSVKVNAKFQAGKNCRLMPMFVTLQGKLQRDQEMTQWAQSKSPKAQRCTADEKKGFTISQVCLEVAREQAAALNEMDFTIEHSQLPTAVKNVTAKFETLAKVMGYLYLSENQQPESSPAQRNQIKLWARITPCKKFFSVHVYQPESILKFENVKTNKLVQTILPLTATNTVVGNIQHRLLHSQLHPTCQLENNWVNTFDNVTYSFKRNAIQNCQTLLVKDCSGRYPMAVYASNIQQDQNQDLTILLGQQTKIQLTSGQGPAPKGIKSWFSKISSKVSSSKSVSGNNLVAIVNGQQVQLPHIIRAQESRSSQPIAEIMEMPNGGIQVIGRHIQVASDGQRIFLKVDQVLQNRTCGICGDFDNEKVAEMRSPKDVPLSSGSLFVASYSFALSGRQNKGSKGQSQGQCQVNKKYQRQVQKEEQLFQSGSEYSSKNQRFGQEYVRHQQQVRQQQAQLGQYYPIIKSSGRQQSRFNQNRHSQSQSESNEQQHQRQQMNQQQQSYGQTLYQQSASQEQQQPSQSSQSQEQGSSNQMVYKQQAFPNPQNSQQICFTLNKLPACAPGYQAKKMTQKKTKVYCMQKGTKAQQMRQQIQQGQHADFSAKHQQQIRIVLPEQCQRV